MKKESWLAGWLVSRFATKSQSTQQNPNGQEQVVKQERVNRDRGRGTPTFVAMRLWYDKDFCAVSPRL